MQRVGLRAVPSYLKWMQLVTGLMLNILVAKQTQGEVRSVVSSQ